MKSFTCKGKFQLTKISVSRLCGRLCAEKLTLGPCKCGPTLVSDNLDWPSFIMGGSSDLYFRYHAFETTCLLQETWNSLVKRVIVKHVADGNILMFSI